MKKTPIFMLSSVLLLGSFTTSCGFFGSDGYTISAVETTTNDDGSVTLKIIYSDSLIDPTIITLPKGEIGNGIDHIETDNSEDGTQLNVTIYFTDGTFKKFALPIVHGRDGLGIKSIVESVNEDGEKTIIISYTNSDVEPTIVTLPKGETGNGIQGIKYTEDQETHAVTLLIEYTNGQTISIPLAAPNGITQVDVDIDKTTGNLIFKFTLTDGTQLPPVDTGRGLATWLNGYVTPDNNLGYEGDFYFNIDALIIYLKKDGKREIVIDFKNSMEQDFANVHFDVNSIDGSLNGLVADYKIPTGKNFYYAKISIPTPSRPNYRFGGWYTEKEYNITLGTFTNLTTVFQDMVLYAHWISL